MARKSMLGPFFLDFKKNSYSYVLIPIAIAQLLLYMATAQDNIFPALMFIVMVVLVGKYTNDATYKLGIPMVITFIIIRYDILKQNFWEGLEERHDNKEDKDDKDDMAHDKDDDKEVEKDDKEHDKDDEKDDEKIDTKKEIVRKLFSKDDDEVDDEVEEEKDTGRSGFTNYDSNGNGFESTIDKIDNTLERLERSYERIMKVGSKLGMGSEMNSLSKSLDVTGILNQKKKLA